MIAVLILAAGTGVAQEVTLEIKSGQVLAVHGNEKSPSDMEGPVGFRYAGTIHPNMNGWLRI